MSSRLASVRRPLVASAAVLATVTTVGLAYRFRSSNDTIKTPIAPIQRDHTGKIQPPKFPSLKSRTQQLADLRRHGTPETLEEYDLLVIGGGATGTGIALDAVTRGLKVALVERDDFSSGTSSKSTKLVHGGVRYLEKAVWNLDYSQLQLVMEALHERKAFLDIAPHLSKSLPILLPMQHWWQAPYVLAGTITYDLLAGSRGLERSYFLSKNKAVSEFPMLRQDNLFGAVVYHDGQHNDSRMNISLAMTASLYGATVLNYVEVTGLEKDANGKIHGAKMRDTLASSDDSASKEFTVRAKGVINATGPFADAVEHMDDPSRKNLVAPASGAHIILPKSLCPNKMGMLNASSDGRVVFILPWEGRTLAGTTDNPCEIERNPIARADEVEFILKEVSKLLEPNSVLTRSDVLATWSGIRPLIMDPQAKNTESLVRSHLITVSPSGLLTCSGGKWTTYRRMAEETVDEAIKTFGLTPQATALPDISGANLPQFNTSGVCVTEKLPVIGAHGYSPSLASQLMEVHPISAEIAHHLATNYGDRAWAVLSSTSSQYTQLLPSFPILEAEIRHGVRAEAACTVQDIISRRTRLSFLDVEGALKALPRVIDIMADELDWSEVRKQHEWLEAVTFLKSMGLAPEKCQKTREEVPVGLGTSKKLAMKELSASSGGILLDC
ncbi:FAD dependent oxidoreductase-domain-containing protein [Dactylonectria estremocensis]|uniref:Glycerol-3-phosphate dehydrogenase n=1 Tax=Dactylonectria estremocensis TaxID=1079267 RepID=A0A9P9FDG0_9HYPO|nr:FAD dependent oxidoreductase-domain-containing protein [Dactylonectria estremocensis]